MAGHQDSTELSGPFYFIFLNTQGLIKGFDQQEGEDESGDTWAPVVPKTRF